MPKHNNYKDSNRRISIFINNRNVIKEQTHQHQEQSQEQKQKQVQEQEQKVESNGGGCWGAFKRMICGS